MSKDDTILIIKFRLKNGTKLYTVLHVQAAENFDDFGWFMWYIKECGFRFTASHTRALHIAFNKLKDEGYVEYGIQYKDYTFEESLELEDGNLKLTPVQLERAYRSGPVI